MTAGIPAKRIRRRAVAPPPEPPSAAPANVDREERSSLGRPGWTVIAAKEFADHLLSARFFVLLVVLGLAAVVPLYFASARIRDLAEEASETPAVFLALFTLGSEQIPFLRVDAFVAIVAPLLGVAFAFDAVNGERSQGTLPRLLSQPIHRDDVINGKFAAGLLVISLVLTGIVGIISGMGLLRLGITPSGTEVLRVIAWLALTILYVALWLAFGLLLSVVLRRAATSALVGFAVWTTLTIFGGLIAGLLAGIIAPIPAGGDEEAEFAAIQLQELVTRLLPSTLYQEASTALLDPLDMGVVSPGSVGQFYAGQERIPTIFSLDQSLLLIWPHVVAILALTVICFAAAYVSFMRQEVRA